jgi:hypothetical protein
MDLKAIAREDVRRREQEAKERRQRERQAKNRAEEATRAELIGGLERLLRLDEGRLSRRMGTLEYRDPKDKFASRLLVSVGDFAFVVEAGRSDGVNVWLQDPEADGGRGRLIRRAADLVED